MAKNTLSSILQKQNEGGNFKDIASAYFSGQGNNSNKLRNLVLGKIFLGGVESKMKDSALKNLQANETEQTYKLAGLTQKWDAYSSLIEDDRNYQKNKNYFFRKAEDNWTEINPNYDKDTKGATSQAAEIKNTEIADLEKRLIEIHNNKIKTGNISNKTYMNKETFFKPFEDYYSEKTADIVAPKNLSVVHNTWDRMVSRFKDKPALSEKEQQERIALANRNSYGYLIEPDEIIGDSAIEVYRKGKVGSDTTAIKMNLDETKINILELEGVTQEQKNYLVRNLKQKDYSRNELQAEIISLSADFNPLKEKRLVAGNNFDERFIVQNKLKTIPKVGEEGHRDYILRKTNYIDVQTKQGNEDINEIRSNVFMLKDLIAEGENENAEAIGYLENIIRDVGVGKLELMALNTSIQASIDPDIVATFKALANEEGGKPFEEGIAEYQKQTFTGILNFVDAIRGKPNMPSKTNNRQGGFSSSNSSN